MGTRKDTGYRDNMNKPILEGDIIHDTHYVGHGKRDHYYEVIFRDNKPGMVKIHNRDYYVDFEDFTFTSETIIGNRFKNPELLK